MTTRYTGNSLVVPNLNALDIRELKEYAKKANEEMAEMSTSAPIYRVLHMGYVFAMNRIAATEDRLRGDFDSALEHELTCQKVYNRMPKQGW